MSDELERDALLWLAFAVGDLEAARAQPGTHLRPRHVAMNAQQAAEKALKAALVLSSIDPPRTHDLNALLQLLPGSWLVVRRRPDLTTLSAQAVNSRYPDDIVPVQPIQAATAVRQAMSVVRLVREDFERRGVSTRDLAPR
jgi:HEPN domain-containing protein